MRIGAKLALYALTRTIGYMVMLGTMTYSYEMFIAIILGLTIGHGIFNLSSNPGEDTTACCQASDPVGRGSRVAPLDGQRFRFEVTGMTCQSCCATVQRAVESLGTAYTVVELALHTGILEVVVDCRPPDGASCAERVCGAIQDVGFDARLLGAESAAATAEVQGTTTAEEDPTAREAGTNGA